MDAAKIKRAEEIFQIVADLSGEERDAVLNERCAGDADLRAFVEQLLSHHTAGMGDFLCKPVFTPLLKNDAQVESDLPRRIGCYEIVRIIGEGGMGVVYEARQAHPQRTVALKVIRSGLPSRNMLRRFQHEAEVLGQLQHPGIACIYEAGMAKIGGERGVVGQQPFFAMELVHGKPLSEFVAERKLALRERLELIAKICDAVQHAHQKGVIHRDLKPGNILVDDTGRPKILDFGVARATDADVQTMTMQTSVGQLIGTVPYMSPEQVTGDSRQLDTRSDVYSLGVILYELLSGSVPHDVRNLSIPEATRKIRDEEPTRLASINKLLRGEIDTIVAKTLEKDKTRRYQSASDIAADIRRHLRGEAIDAQRHSGWYLLRKALSRYKAAVGVAAAFALLITCSTIALAFMYRNQSLARDRERGARMEAEAVNRFLQDMLASANPKIARHPNVTIREVFDDATREIDAGSFEDQPEIEATIRTTIAEAYHAMGLYDAAQSHLKAALNIRRRLFGDEHPDVAATRNDLGELLLAKADYAGAQRHFQAALDINRRLFGEEHPNVVTGLNNLALLMQAKGDYAKAETLLRRVLALRRKLLGDEHTFVARSLNNLAVLLRVKGDYVGAKSLYREALAMNRKLLGAEHLEVANNLNNLALLLHYQGNYAEAEPLYREALAIRRKRLGDEHPEVTTTLSGLAGLLYMRGNYAEAEPLFRKVLTMRRQLLGNDHPRVARSAANLAGLLRDIGDYTGAELLYREALAIARKTHPEGHPEIANSLARLGHMLIKMGKYRQAEPLLRECLAIREVKMSDHWSRFSAMSLLGASLAGQERLDEAEPFLLKGYAGLNDDPRTKEQYKRQALERLINLYEAWDKPDQVAEWQAKLPATQSAQPSPNP